MIKRQSGKWQITFFQTSKFGLGKVGKVPTVVKYKQPKECRHQQLIMSVAGNRVEISNSVNQDNMVYFIDANLPDMFGASYILNHKMIENRLIKSQYSSGKLFQSKYNKVPVLMETMVEFVQAGHSGIIKYNKESGEAKTSIITAMIFTAKVPVKINLSLAGAAAARFKDIDCDTIMLLILMAIDTDKQGKSIGEFRIDKSIDVELKEYVPFKKPSEPKTKVKVEEKK